MFPLQNKCLYVRHFKFLYGDTNEHGVPHFQPQIIVVNYDIKKKEVL
jgi:hypothetical protein